MSQMPQMPQMSQNKEAWSVEHGEMTKIKQE
jgi:hypothetical protein